MYTQHSYSVAMPWSKKPVVSARRKALLSTPNMRLARKLFRKSRPPCARCKKSIDYDGPYLLPGTRRKNPRYLHVGHKIDRSHAIDLGWTDTQIDQLENMQAECAHCSNKSGAITGRARQKPLRLIITTDTLDRSREW